MKIPFTLDTWLKDKSQKVETRDGRPSRILCWDRRGERTLVVLVQQPLGYDDVLYYYESGWADGVGRESDEDLFLITPEPELSEFEKAIKDLVLAIDEGVLQELGVFEEENLGAWAIKQAGELLTLAKQQLLQSGELLTQEHHEKLMETQYNETLDGVKKNWRDYFTPQAVTDIYNAGRNDVLKGLPRWRQIKDCDTVVREPHVGTNMIGEKMLYIGSNCISISTLEKLPGFKEDESHE